MLGALSALFLHLYLRRVWAPYPSSSGPGWPGIPELVTAAGRILGAVADWWAPLFACGFPLAAVALALPEGRRLLARYGVLLGLTVALPFGAGIYTGAAFPAEHFYAEDVPRLLVYALPLLFSLAVVALGRLGPRRPPEPSAESDGATNGFAIGVAVASALALVAALVLPVTALDRYRRADLRGRTDGPFVLAFCRDSLAFARRLAFGSSGRLRPGDPPLQGRQVRSARHGADEVVPPRGMGRAARVRAGRRDDRSDERHGRGAGARRP